MMAIKLNLEPLAAATLVDASLLLGSRNIRKLCIDWQLGLGTARPLVVSARERNMDRVILTGFPDDPEVLEQAALGEHVIAKPNWDEVREWMRDRRACLEGAR